MASRKFGISRKPRAKLSGKLVPTHAPQAQVPRRIVNMENRAAESFVVGFGGLYAAIDASEKWAEVQEGNWVPVLDVFDFAEFERTTTAAVLPDVLDVVEREGKLAYEEIATRSDFYTAGAAAEQPKPNAGVMFQPGRGAFRGGLRFDMSDGWAIQRAQQFAGRFVAEVSQATRQSIREAVSDSFVEQFTVDQLKQRLRQTVGLTRREARAVRAYRGRLMNGGMDPDRVEVLTNRYHRLSLNRRAERIARTEIMEASNYGKQQGWMSAADHGLVDASTASKEWITIGEGSKYGGPCPVCGPMDTVRVVGIETPFQLNSGRTLQMPPAHPHCRCTATLWPPEPPEDWDPEYGQAQA